jgi:hypothetical protein
MKIRLRCLRVLLGASLVAGSMAHAQGRFQFDTAPGYLSKHVVPSRYALTLDLDPARDTFRHWQAEAGKPLAYTSVCSAISSASSTSMPRTSDCDFEPMDFRT